MNETGMNEWDAARFLFMFKKYKKVPKGNIILNACLNTISKTLLQHN